MSPGATTLMITFCSRPRSWRSCTSRIMTLKAGDFALKPPTRSIIPEYHKEIYSNANCIQIPALNNHELKREKIRINKNAVNRPLISRNTEKVEVS